ncbi:helix-turn-helix transcriptional regulator [Helcococcus kunzii]|uniref:helix-turn-helix transcriptional regulator n=1 Tax=Helcococcus kunzii TaxID=40091 RepID=UPI0024ACB259|nr:ECF-type sigma factor [Helcococcus kunzii]
MTGKERSKIFNIFKGLSRYRSDKNIMNISEVEEKYLVLDESFKRSDEVMFLLYSKLSKDEKRYIDLYFREGLTVLEITQIMYVSKSTYYRRMKSIYRKLLNYMNDFETIFRFED